MFTYQNNHLYVEKIALTDIATRFGTPCYVYSKNGLQRQWQLFADELKNQPHLLCFAVKANSNLAILQQFKNFGAGFDIVSQGELARVLKAGGDANKIIFSGVGKSNAEILLALQSKIYCFNVESVAELTRIDALAKQLNVKAPIALRINPDIDAETHPYISTGLKENKFGIAINEALTAYQYATSLENINIVGLAFHIGSQITQLQPFIQAVKHALALIDDLKKCSINIQHLDIGGGLGVQYHDEKTISPSEYIRAVLELIKHRSLKLILAPGRALAAAAGVLLTRVEYLKFGTEKNFAIVDAAMNDFMRPALYGFQHKILPVNVDKTANEKIYDIVGPVCETGDFFVKQQPFAIAENDLLAITMLGAYGFCLSSNYNSRPRIAEVLVDGDQVHLIRQRETIEDLFQHENLV